jgi:multiple sugar transport system ATP-binding protein
LSFAGDGDEWLLVRVGGGKGERSRDMATVGLNGVNKVYPNGYHAVHDLTLNIQEGEFMVLVGPSGCGKTTVLRMVAGLEDISDGELRIGERVVNDVEPKDRDIAMVFQNYALYPHMTVAENIGFALKLRKMPKAEIRKKVEEAAEILGLTEWLDRKPKQLSGGQRQRVAMGRAIVREPSVFLMDEPLSNLDAKLRVKMRAEVRRIQQRLGVATIYVTHDQIEAMTMGDRVAVLKDGRLQQCDTPQNLYDFPVNQFVGAFIGSPAMNLYKGQLMEGGRNLKIGSQTLELSDNVHIAHPSLASYANKEVTVGIRPEGLKAVSSDVPRSRALDVQVSLVEALGSELMVHFGLDATVVRLEDVQDDEEEILTQGGEGVARIEPSVSVKTGDRLRLEVDLEHLHFFDPTTGVGIY